MYDKKDNRQDLCLSINGPGNRRHVTTGLPGILLGSKIDLCNYSTPFITEGSQIYEIKR
jgi:hypothetical protein